jgi:lysozyme family protein
VTNADLAISHVLEIEGGFVNHPSDPGGATKYGITLATLCRWRGATVTADDVEKLSEAEARQIYLELYWRPAGLDLLTNPAVAAIVFDQVVNRGPGPAIRTLQIALQSTTGAEVDIDGHLGPKTASVANCAPQAILTIRLFVECQRAYLDLWRRRPERGVFLAGWLARTWRFLELLPRP